MNTNIESDIAAFFERDHCVLTGSGTTAIYAILKSLDLPADARVLYPDITCQTAVNAAIYANANPIFSDVELQTLNMDIDTAVNTCTEHNPAVVVATHMYGHPLDIERLRQRLNRSDIFILEDAAQAYGNTVNARPVGAFGDAAVVSFGPGKLLDCSSGGAILTDSAELAQRCRSAIARLSDSDLEKQTLKSKYLQEVFMLSRNGGSITQQQRHELQRRYKHAYLSPCSSSVIETLAHRFCQLPNLAQQRRERAAAIKQALQDVIEADWGDVDDSVVRWRLTGLVQNDRQAALERLRSAGLTVSTYFEPLHRSFDQQDDDFPNATRAFEQVINIDLCQASADLDRTLLNLEATAFQAGLPQ